MVRVIKQETYDDVVRENIEDLEMSAEEAIEDAIKQFEAQVFVKHSFPSIQKPEFSNYSKKNPFSTINKCFAAFFPLRA